MRAVIQRVENAVVSVEGSRVGGIDRGLLVYVGIGKDDVAGDARWLADKIADLRIFPDEDYKMNRSIRDENGGILVISQFTLYGDARKGRRPSYNGAAAPDLALPLYEEFVSCLQGTGLKIETGEYRAAMDVSSVNKGPITIILDTNKAV